MGENGFYPRDMFGLRKPWDDRYNNAVVDSYGQEWVGFIDIGVFLLFIISRLFGLIMY